MKAKELIRRVSSLATAAAALLGTNKANGDAGDDLRRLVRSGEATNDPPFEPLILKPADVPMEPMLLARGGGHSSHSSHASHSSGSSGRIPSYVPAVPTYQPYVTPATPRPQYYRPYTAPTYVTPNYVAPVTPPRQNAPSYVAPTVPLPRSAPLPSQVARATPTPVPVIPQATPSTTRIEFKNGVVIFGYVLAKSPYGISFEVQDSKKVYKFKREMLADNTVLALALPSAGASL